MGPAGARMLLGFVALVAAVSRDAPAGAPVEPRTGVDTPLERDSWAPRVAAWADELPPLDVVSASTLASIRIRLYAPDGAIDSEARDAFERVASGDGAPHPLSTRVEQLVLMAAYHFARAPVFIVSAWREHASRHGTGEAIDFKLKGVRAARLAGYLRGCRASAWGSTRTPGRSSCTSTCATRATTGSTPPRPASTGGRPSCATPEPPCETRRGFRTWIYRNSRVRLAWGCLARARARVTRKTSRCRASASRPGRGDVPCRSGGPSR